MKILVYNDLNIGNLQDKVNKVIGCLAAGDFQTADVKKINGGYYRARLDYTNRLLFSITKYQEETYILILEVIHNHVYEKSKFLNGLAIDEHKLVPVASPAAVPEADKTPINYINQQSSSFNILDKPISFDDMQESILHLPSPAIIIGSAGSGKTAITLEKLKMLKGKVLYTTLSPYLVENASDLYSSYHYENGGQEVEFLSFYEYMCSMAMPAGREAEYLHFERWIARYSQSHKIKDAYRVFEEIKGVITGSMVSQPYLSLQEYLDLGIKQSIFSAEERCGVYDLFTKYLSWMTEEGYFDSNLVSFGLLDRVKPSYDYVVVDEVQDLTMVQLMLILKSLHHPANFILCGDSNQIVHPNFFSWSQIKTLFYHQDLKGSLISVLATNYRNTAEVTAIANQLLLIKNTRFGSIDKESNYLVIPNSSQKGQVEYLENNAKINHDLNAKTSLSTRFAVLVLRNEDKAAAKKFYKTPLIFSIQEAKGLEYENIILYNMISTYDEEFRELTNGVTRNDLQDGELGFSRAKDKSDKSLEEYKFYVNSLYVGITRAVKNLYLIESNKKHALLGLLGLVDFTTQSSLTDQASSTKEWQQEAHRLEMQGKLEQADAIREQILQLQPVPWTVSTHKDFEELKSQALNPEVYNRKAKDRFYHYVVLQCRWQYVAALGSLKYRLAERYMNSGVAEINTGQTNLYAMDNLKMLQPFLLRYGVDFRNEVNFTPLMCALLFQAPQIIDHLLSNGAKLELTDNLGRTAFQVALFEACDKPDTRTALFLRFYHRLQPEHTRVKINNRLIKINSHQAEFLILQFMLTLLEHRLIHGADQRLQMSTTDHIVVKPGYQTADFTRFFTHLGEQVLPAYRCKAAYISAVLSKNELTKGGWGNKQLFLRLKKGVYVPNPAMEIQIGDQWVNVYDQIDMELVAGASSGEGIHFVYLLNQYCEQLKKNPDSLPDYTNYWQELPELDQYPES